VGARGAPGGAAARGAARDRAGRGGDSAALVQGPGIRHRESIPRRGRIHRRPPQRQAHPGVSRSIIICSTEFLTEHMVITDFLLRGFCSENSYCSCMLACSLYS
jgi:hypothetical protein